MRIVYTKYSNDRALGYRIRTDIAIKDDGTKVAIKRPIDDIDTRHIEKMYCNYEKLNESFKDTKIKLNKTKKTGNALEFEFVNGQTLEEYLDELVHEKNFDEFEKVYKEYLLIFQNLATETFVAGKDYQKMFGSFELEGEYKAMPITDIDLIFPNVYVNQDEWTVIDYEWTFEFLIPVKYVLFRTIHYYLAFRREEFITSHVDMYKLAGITKDEKEFFIKCEKSFQKSLMKNHYALWNFDDEMHTHFYYPYFESDYKSKLFRKRIGTIEIQYKNGDVEEREYEPVVNADRLCSYEFKIDGSKIKTIIIRPYKEACRFEGGVFVGKTEDEIRYIDYKCNGQICAESTIAFFHAPEFVIENIGDDLKYIFIGYTIVDITKEKLMREVLYKEGFENVIDDQTEEIINLKSTVSGNEKMLKNYHEVLTATQKQLGNVNQELNTIRNSYSWKIAKPIRKIGSFIKKIR